MTTTRNTQKLLAEALLSRGFERCGEGIFELPSVRDGSAIGWAGTPLVRERAGHYISVYVGVRNDEFNRLYCHLTGYEYDRCAASAVKSLSKFVAGDDAYQWWVGKDDSDEHTAELCARVATAVVTDGIPVMTSLLSNEALARWLADEVNDPVKGAVALLLANQRSRALSSLDAELDRIARNPSRPSSDNSWDAYYHRFAERLRGHPNGPPADRRVGS